MTRRRSRGGQARPREREAMSALPKSVRVGKVELKWIERKLGASEYQAAIPGLGELVIIRVNSVTFQPCIYFTATNFWSGGGEPSPQSAADALTERLKQLKSALEEIV